MRQATISRMSVRGIVLFAALGVIWGVPYLFIKIAGQELSSEFMVLSRSLLAAVLLLPVAIRMRALRPVLRDWRPVVAYSYTALAVPWYFLNLAGQRLPSSTVGLLLSAVPLATVIAGIVLGKRDGLSPANWLGMLIGSAGVAAIVGLDLGGSDLVGVAQLAVVVVGYAFGWGIMARWLSDLPSVGVVTVSLALVAITYMPIVALTGGWPSVTPSVAAITAIVVLAAICSVAAFLLMFALIKEVGAVRGSAVTYVNPAVAVAAGAIVLGETITWWTVVGFALVLLGSHLVTQRDRRVDGRAAR